MDQQRQIKSIEEVQETEAAAAKRLADAEREKERTIAEARERASAIVSDAINESKKEHEEKVSKFTAQLEDEKRRAVERALKESKSISRKRLGNAKRAELVNSLVKIILGE